LNADIRSREATYQTLRGSDQGSTDWARIGGNLLSPMNLALGGTAAPASVMGAIGTSAGLGPLRHWLTPSFAKDSDIAGEKLTNPGLALLPEAPWAALEPSGRPCFHPQHPAMRVFNCSETRT